MKCLFLNKRTKLGLIQYCIIISTLWQDSVVKLSETEEASVINALHNRNIYGVNVANLLTLLLMEKIIGILKTILFIIILILLRKGLILFKRSYHERKSA